MTTFYIVSGIYLLIGIILSNVHSLGVSDVDKNKMLKEVLYNLYIVFLWPIDLLVRGFWTLLPQGHEQGENSTTNPVKSVDADVTYNGDHENDNTEDEVEYEVIDEDKENDEEDEKEEEEIENDPIVTKETENKIISKIEEYGGVNKNFHDQNSLVKNIISLIMVDINIQTNTFKTIYIVEIQKEISRITGHERTAQFNRKINQNCHTLKDGKVDNVDRGYFRFNGFSVADVLTNNNGTVSSNNGKDEHKKNGNSGLKKTTKSSSKEPSSQNKGNHFTFHNPSVEFVDNCEREFFWEDLLHKGYSKEYKNNSECRHLYPFRMLEYSRYKNNVDRDEDVYQIVKFEDEQRGVKIVYKTTKLGLIIKSRIEGNRRCKPYYVRGTLVNANNAEDVKCVIEVEPFGKNQQKERYDKVQDIMGPTFFRKLMPHEEYVRIDKDLDFSVYNIGIYDHLKGQIVESYYGTELKKTQ